MALARTTVTLPEEMLRDIDEVAGPRGRSRYVVDAVASQLKRDKLGRAIRETAGIMVGRPGQRSQEEIDRYVDELRSGDRDL